MGWATCHTCDIMSVRPREIDRQLRSRPVDRCGYAQCSALRHRQPASASDPDRRTLMPHRARACRARSCRHGRAVRPQHRRAHRPARPPDQSRRTGYVERVLSYEEGPGEHAPTRRSVRRGERESDASTHADADDRRSSRRSVMPDDSACGLSATLSGATVSGLMPATGQLGRSAAVIGWFAGLVCICSAWRSTSSVTGSGS